MTIADPTKKPRARKKNVKIAAGPAVDKPAAAEPKPSAQAKGEAPRWPDPSEITSILMRVAGRSQKLMQDYVEKHKTLPSIHPSFTPSAFSGVFAKLAAELLNSPEKFVDSQIAFWQDYARLCQAALARFSGREAVPVIHPASNDKRFQDSAWQDVWLFDFIKQSYLLGARWAQGLVKQADGLEPKLARKIDFYTRQMVDAVAPSNFWMTNPQVLRATMESGGENLIKGLEKLLTDLERGQGQLSISMSDMSAFKFGENIAMTKGKVVFQNDLIQLLQYAPLTPKVHKTPLLIVAPWINKFYVLDLREKNSFIRYLVEQGHTVFCVSWVNPDIRHADINFDDYMESGLLAALREMKRITGENEANVVGYCIGGTLLASTLAYLKGLGAKRPKDIPEVASATYLVTLIDFAEPGDLGVFVDEEQIKAQEERMKTLGFLDAPVMATTFNLLRSNDLIWSFVVNNYLLGKEPFPFDLLTWNSDSTNLPAAMQSFYLRNMYLRNKLIEPNGVSMKDVPIDLTKITTPSFCLSTRDDHIAPWRSTYASTQIYKGPVTFVLSGSGHIAGVVNPPAANKYGYWTNPVCPADPDDWLAKAEAHDGSWWPAWNAWLKPYAGAMVAAREPVNGLEDAPGSYVMVRVV